MLEVRDLSRRVQDRRRHGPRGPEPQLHAAPDETLGIVGESGSGKTVTSLAILGLLPKTAQITGEVLFRGRDLLG